MGHKGAVWQARLSADATIAATAAADFSAYVQSPFLVHENASGAHSAIYRKVWDTHTGESLHTLQHGHIVRAVAFPIQFNPQVLATGGMEKKLRIFDLTRSGTSNSSSPTSPHGSSGVNGTGSNPSVMASYEIGPGIHEGTIKSIIWNQDYNILTTASEDRKIRWWDLRSRHPFVEYTVDGAIGSCELNTLATIPNDPGILSVAAGKSAYFFEGGNPGRLLKKVDLKYEVASVAVNSKTGRYVTGEAGDTWARVYDLDTDEELGTQSLLRSRKPLQ
jgi:serine-threonine kinase receptor-associated protein